MDVKELTASGPHGLVVASCVGNLPTRVRTPLRFDSFFWICDHTASVELEVGGLEKHIGSSCLVSAMQP